MAEFLTWFNIHLDFNHSNVFCRLSLRMKLWLSAAKQRMWIIKNEPCRCASVTGRRVMTTAILWLLLAEVRGFQIALLCLLSHSMCWGVFSWEYWCGLRNRLRRLNLCGNAQKRKLWRTYCRADERKLRTIWPVKRGLFIPRFYARFCFFMAFTLQDQII